MKTVMAIAGILLLMACETDSSRLERYTDIYFDIMIAKESYLDSALAANSVDSILDSYGYDIQSFEKESYELFSKNRRYFTTMIDSVRKRAEAEMRRILADRVKQDTTQIKPNQSE